jgi:hypothetical protein
VCLSLHAIWTPFLRVRADAVIWAAIVPEVALQLRAAWLCGSVTTPFVLQDCKSRIWAAGWPDMIQVLTPIEDILVNHSAEAVPRGKVCGEGMIIGGILDAGSGPLRTHMRPQLTAFHAGIKALASSSGLFDDD